MMNGQVEVKEMEEYLEVSANENNIYYDLQDAVNGVLREEL